jgi:hypothetical protein
MDRPGAAGHIGDMLDIHTNAKPTRELVIAALVKRSFCTLASVSDAGRPHVAGVLYEAVGTALWINTVDASRKARNVASNPHVAVCVPVRRAPVGPPSVIQFQARGEVLAPDHPEVVKLLAKGELESITSHGELEVAGSCFLRITPNRRVNTYGLGLPLRKLISDPLHAVGSVDLG